MYLLTGAMHIESENSHFINRIEKLYKHLSDKVKASKQSPQQSKQGGITMKRTVTIAAAVTADIAAVSAAAAAVLHIRKRSYT